VFFSCKKLAASHKLLYTVSGLITDRHLVLCSAALDRPVREKKTFSYRDYKAIDHESLEGDITQLPLVSEPANVPGDKVASLNALVHQYEEVRQVIDSHAKIKTKQVVLRDSAPLINASVL